MTNFISFVRGKNSVALEIDGDNSSDTLLYGPLITKHDGAHSCYWKFNKAGVLKIGALLAIGTIFGGNRLFPVPTVQQ